MALETRHGLQIVIEYIRRRRLQNLQGAIGAATKIRRQNFDGNSGGLPAYGTDAGGEMRGTAVGKIITVYRSDHHVLQVHQPDGPGQMFRFILIKRSGPAMGDIEYKFGVRVKTLGDSSGLLY